MLDTDYESEMLCPWCGYAQEDLFEAGDAAWEDGGELKTECQSCGRDFTSHTDVDIRYTTRRPGDGKYDSPEYEVVPEEADQ